MVEKWAKEIDTLLMECVLARNKEIVDAVHEKDNFFQKGGIIKRFKLSFEKIVQILRQFYSAKKKVLDKWEEYFSDLPAQIRS